LNQRDEEREDKPYLESKYDHILSEDNQADFPIQPILSPSSSERKGRRREAYKQEGKSKSSSFSHNSAENKPNETINKVKNEFGMSGGRGGW